MILHILYVDQSKLTLTGRVAALRQTAQPARFASVAALHLLARPHKAGSGWRWLLHLLKGGALDVLRSTAHPRE